MTAREPYSRRNGCQGGYTLIELILVMLVIGVVLAVAFPRFGVLGGGDLRLESRTLIGHVQGLYGEATFTRKLHRLVFDLDEQRYWAEVEVGGEQGFGPVGRTFLKPKILPDNIRLVDVTTARSGKHSDGHAYAYFYPLGRADFTTVHLRDGDQVMTLQVNPITGRVSVADRYLEGLTG